VPEWLGVTNTDVELGTLFLMGLLETHYPDDVLAIAPRVTRVVDGREQNPFLLRRPSRWYVAAVRLFHRSPALFHALQMAHPLVARARRWRTRRISRRADVRQRCTRAIYAPHGSIFFLSRRFFLRGGILAPAWHMFGEEIHIAEQIRAAGGLVLFRPDLLAVHRAGAVTGALGIEEERRCLLESTEGLLREYFRREGRTVVRGRDSQRSPDSNSG
jgi:hypothetical protein